MTHPPSSPRKRSPLWVQLVLALLTALLLVNLLTAPIARHMVSDFLFKQVEGNSRSSLTLLAATIIDAVITEDIPLLETIAAQSLDQTPNMIGLSIENELGEQLVQHTRADTAIHSRISSYSHFIEYEGERFGNMPAQFFRY